MSKSTRKILGGMGGIIILLGGILLTKNSCWAISGNKAKNVTVKVFTYQGEDWFKVLTRKTDEKGIIKIKNVLPGWYKLEIREEDQASGQTLALQARMLDNNGKRLQEKTPVNLYLEFENKKIFIGTKKTDEEGWLSLEGLTSGTKYLLEIKEKYNDSLSKKENQARIKVKAKIKESNWFTASYQRTDSNLVLEVKNVLPGYYKFSYKSGDRDPKLPFALKMKLLDEKGKNIKNPTAVKLWTYTGKNKKDFTFIGQITTDENGWLILPKVMTETKYKIELVK